MEWIQQPVTRVYVIVQLESGGRRWYIKLDKRTRRIPLPDLDGEP